MAKRARSLANDTPKRSAHPLNPLAGDVPVPEDEREIHAALRAGRITLRVFPYFGWRYGERGRQFTRSDSAWLAWLSRHDQDAVVDKVLWLGAILANRGMPRLLLETHLGVMERQLSRAIPARWWTSSSPPLAENPAGCFVGPPCSS